jgi:hypothetical protein
MPQGAGPLFFQRKEVVMAKQRVKIFLLSMGRVILADRKVGNSFIMLTAEEATGSDTVAKRCENGEPIEERKRLNYHKMEYPVGAIIEIEATDSEASSIFGKGRWLGRWDDDALVTRLRAAEVAAVEYDRGRKALAKAKSDDPLLEALRPIRDEYHRLPTAQRPHLLAKVVLFITR